MKSKFIRFVKDKNHLIDDIKNGFILREHDIRFRASLSTILPPLIDFWSDKNISSDIIDPIKKQYNNLDADSFWKWLGNETDTNNLFNLKLGYITTQINSAKIKMKCFTELRDNQKMHPNHSLWFGEYGIVLPKEWIKKNNGDRIIYVDKDSEITNRIAMLSSMLFSSTLEGRGVITAIFDVLSFTEIESNSHEYEWRIVGNHNFAGKPYGDYPDTIPFLIKDIITIYVKEPEDIDIFKKALEKKASTEGCTKIPDIQLSEKIFLTTEELKEIDNIHTRR